MEPDVSTETSQCSWDVVSHLYSLAECGQRQ